MPASKHRNCRSSTNLAANGDPIARALSASAVNNEWGFARCRAQLEASTQNVVVIRSLSVAPFFE